MAEDYYKTLGVAKDASQADIQKAYRELARKYHPDVNPGDKNAKKKFQEVQTAFEVLNDPEKREMYDRYGSSFETFGAGGPRRGAAGAGAGPGPGWGGFTAEDVDLNEFFGGEAPGGLGDIFRHFTRSATQRGRRPRGGPSRGSDLLHDVDIPFQTAVTGGQVQLGIQRPDGKTETISVKVPAGIEGGKKIRLRGQGQPAPGGAPGDLLLRVRVAPHPFFHRQGSDLHVRVPVTLAEAAAGGKVDVPTPKGTVSLTVPAGTSSGTRLRVRGYGVPQKNGAAGDLFAEIQIVLPKDLTEDDRATLRAIGERHPQSPRANLRW